MAIDRLLWKNLLDFFILAIMGFILLAIKLWVTPVERGYFEDDLSIRLPYRDQTISEGLLAGLGFALIIFTVVLTELVRDHRGKSVSVGDKYLSGSVIPAWVWESYITIGIFTFGAVCQQLTCNLAKNVIGRLRPHFYDVCRPEPEPSSNQNHLGYILQYRCTATNDPYKLQDMRVSFPSAHSSFAMYCAIFFIFYTQTKGKWRGSKLLRHAVQFAVLMGAWYVGLSRFVDNMHHWSDIAAGFFIGAVIAFITFVFVLKPKKYSSWEEPAQPTTSLPRPVYAR